MKLTTSILNQSKHYQTPFLLVDLEQVRKNYRNIKESIKNVKVFYAMKANDHSRILETLHQDKCSFEISSQTELERLLKIGVSPEHIMCLNTIKSPQFLTTMAQKNVTVMAFDSYDEVDKIARYAPKSEVIVRIVVSNEGSDWPLTKKFGVNPPEALPLLLYAKRKGLQPIGITFHVGSQCLNVSNWVNAIEECGKIWQEAEKKNISLSLLSLGGGLPTKHVKPIPTIHKIGKTINNAIKKNFKNKGESLTITIEPGRGMVGDSAILVTEVVGKATRGNEEWIYIDTGVFNGLMETIEKFEYEIKTEKARAKKSVTIAGPSCDSVDIPFQNVVLPKVHIGERIYILNAGAYTTVYAARFNGFDTPAVNFL